MRVGLTVLALLLDILCLLLMAGVLLFTHPPTSAQLGIALFAVVIGANLPGLIWSLMPPKAAQDHVIRPGIVS
jgi:hypothetical protein